MEPEVGDVGGNGHVVVAHCFVDILAVLHQHSLWPHAFFSPPGGTVQQNPSCPAHPHEGTRTDWAWGDCQGSIPISIT